MKHTFTRRIICLLLMAAMIAALCPTFVSAQGETRGFQKPDGRVIVAETDYTIAKGVKETQVILNNSEGTAQVYGYMATIAPNASVKPKASYAGYYTEGSTVTSRAEAAKSLKWNLRTTTGQAADYEKATGEQVALAVNGDYYNMQTCQSLGYLIMEGNVVQTGVEQEPYFAVLKDGSYAIRDYGTPHDDVAEAISGPFWLVKNGEIMVADTDPTLAPRHSIGLKEDGTLVVFMADGRAGFSAGMTVYEIAKIQKAQGVVNAIYLDGGGSATFSSRHEGSEQLKIQNHPSDGPERVVASALLFVKTEKSTGKFDHAALKPNNELFVAGSSVQFTANGVDGAGYPVALPESLTWKLKDASFGTIDASGLFRSNGKCGTVEVELLWRGDTVGATSIEVQEPDALSFASNSINLAFKASSDLGLRVYCQNRLMELSGFTFNWKLTPVSEGKTPEQIGSFSGNTFTAVKAAETLQATVEVSYTRTDGTVLSDTIFVEIGRMPQVIFDFEPDENGNVLKYGEYDWGNSSYGATWPEDTDPITYLGWDAAANALITKTESGPFTFDGSYLGGPNDATYHPASTLLGARGYSFFTWHTGYMKQHSALLNNVTADDGQVRFGDHAMELKYDYTDLAPGYRNVNLYIRNAKLADDVTTDVNSGYAIDGTPSGLGVWVYAPEGTPNYWLWTTVAYWDEASGLYKDAYLHFTTQEGRSIQYNGIYWDGWMYCEADLSGLAQYVTPEHPLKLITGRPLILMTFIPGGSANENGDKIPMGDFAKGSIYFDNFRVVYGDTVDDMDNPVVSSLTANGTELKEDGSSVLTDSKITLAAAFTDPDGDNATGIHAEKTAIYVDGLHQELPTATATNASVTVTLPNGEHSVMISVADKFGNVTKVTRYFTVNAAQSKLGKITLTGEATATIGTTYALTLAVENSDQVKSLEAQIKLTETFGAPTVEFTDGYTGTSAYESGILTVQATTDAPKAGAAAKIVFTLAPSIAKGTVMSYTVEKGTFEDGENSLTFAQSTATVGVTAPYALSADIMVAGSTGKIYVTTADGKSAGKVSVYAVKEGEEDELVGITNKGGVLVTNRFCRTAGEKFVIYAKGESGYSFRVSGVTNGIGSDEVTPINVRLNAGKDATTTQSLTWFSAAEYTAQKAVVQFTTQAAYQSGTYEFTTVTGTSKLIAFNGSGDDNNATLLNTVTLSGLQAGTTYCYRVGDGIEGHFSEVSTFTTAKESGKTSFFVMGDTQLSNNPASDAESIAYMEAIAAAIAQKGVDFGIQTGDYIDVANSLGAWNQIQGLFAAQYPTTPIIQVLGNHEYYGDMTGDKAAAIFNLPDKDYYSVQYGDVYVAVINCNADIASAAKWLVEDAAKSDCAWKLLTLHQPPYYANPKGSSAPYNKAIPAAAEQAGIDFVFSGHDHSYARTSPILNGEVNEENGVVYFICGDLGEKSRSSQYKPEDNPDFHFAKITQNYDAVYLMVELNDGKMTVTAYNVDGTVLDSVSKEKRKTDPEPTPEKHDYIYDRTTGKLTCTETDCTQKEAPKDYTGWAKDSKSGKRMYFLAGKYKTGWFTIGEDLYHFDAKTGEEHKVTVIENTVTTCGVQGKKTVKCECGETKTVELSRAGAHINVPKTNEDGSVYYICSRCGRMTIYDLTFVDVKDSDWFAPTVDYVVHHGLFNGRNEMIFDPNASMTRAELVSVLWRLVGSPNFEDTSSTVFADVPAGCWYAAAVNWAYKNKIVNGIDETHFAPDAKITREQIVTILFRYADASGFASKDRADITKDFKDAGRVSPYAKEAMAWAVAAKLIQGDNSQINPLNNAIRAEVATMIMRYDKLRTPQESQE